MATTNATNPDLQWQGYQSVHMSESLVTIVTNDFGKGFSMVHKKSNGKLVVGLGDLGFDRAFIFGDPFGIQSTN